MKTGILIVTCILGGSCVVSAAGLPCTIPVEKDTPASKLEGLAKISEMQARTYALESIKGSQDSYAEGELKVQQGCLVYVFDIPNQGKSGGAVEIVVDAGDGTILLNKQR